MTISNLALKALSIYALRQYQDCAVNSQSVVKKKSLSKSVPFQNQNGAIKKNYLDTTRKLPSSLSFINNNTTFCEKRDKNISSLGNKAQKNISDDVKKTSYSINDLQQEVLPFISFLSQKYQENPHINIIHMKSSGDSFNVTHENINDITRPLLDKKIYDIAMNETTISKTEGICYNNEINGKYMRLHHLEECPDISILKIGDDNNYILSPSKAYLKKIVPSNAPCSFKNMILRGNPSDHEMLKQLFTVIAKITSKGKNVSIIDTQSTTSGACFRVSIE